MRLFFGHSSEYTTSFCTLGGVARFVFFRLSISIGLSDPFVPAIKNVQQFCNGSPDCNQTV